MKGGGKEESKMINGGPGPLFPRLSLNEIDQKVGPRPPPRNKMALYQRLSISSLPNSSSTCSIQGVNKERGAFSPFQNSPASDYSPGGRSSLTTDGVSNNTSENSMITGNCGNLDAIENLLPATTKCNSSKPCNFPQTKVPLVKNDEVDFSLSTFVHTGVSLDSSNNHLLLNKEKYFSGTTSSLQLQTGVTKRLERAIPTDLESEVQVRIMSGEVPKLAKASQNHNTIEPGISARENISAGISLKTLAADNHSELLNLVPASSNIQQNTGHLGETSSSKAWGQVNKAMQENNPVMGCLPRAVLTPDDVVGMIGLKNFWKARSEIIKQQKIFSKQVFELHRIIKSLQQVQNLLAGSPHTLHDENLCLGKAFDKSSSAKELPLKSVPEPPLSYGKLRDEVQWSKFVDYQGENLPLPPLNIDSTAVNTHFGPYMEKSAKYSTKGLICRPSYPRPGPCPPPGGFLPYGSCGTANATTSPSWDFFPSMPYGFVFCSPPMAMSPTYFAPYGMLVMNPSLSTSSIEHVRHLAIDKEEFSARRNAGDQGGVVLKDAEKMENTETSPKRRTSSNDALPLFPASPIARGSEQPGQTQTRETEQKTQVIRVIPRKPRFASDSAARMFQSVEE